MAEQHAQRPYVLASAACSLDGYLDDTSGQRLMLSGPADLDRVDEVRAGVDAILVGAGTVRADNPRLLVRSPDRRRAREKRGEPADPAKVVISSAGELDPAAAFFTAGDAPRLVYTPDAGTGAARARLGAVAEVVGAGDPTDPHRLDPHRLLADLAGRGVRRLLVEGGSAVHTLFFAADLVDELHLVIAPFFVGDPDAPRFVGPAAFPQGPGRPMRLQEARPVGDVVLLRYLA
ncbi:MAG TPA: dihydrofolate reductase family protein [Pseudonocardia sp.]|jgi:5-amino-6-(5-phosphoribosylamino)uracil reductase|nr:dihydrofolate reductase family protein [Pseudonocardia sp.]